MTADGLVQIFCKHLAKGSLDDYIPRVIAAINDRQRTKIANRMEMGIQNLSELGTHVRVTVGIRPKYLVGLEGVVVPRPANFAATPIRYGTIYVDMGAPVRKYGRILGIPASCLEAV